MSGRPRLPAFRRQDRAGADHGWSGRSVRWSTIQGWMPAPAAQRSQASALARRCTWTMRLPGADAIGRASAPSVARFPAPITIEPGGSSYEPIRRSRISE